MIWVFDTVARSVSRRRGGEEGKLRLPFGRVAIGCSVCSESRAGKESLGSALVFFLQQCLSHRRPVETFLLRCSNHKFRSGLGRVVGILFGTDVMSRHNLGPTSGPRSGKSRLQSHQEQHHKAPSDSRSRQLTQQKEQKIKKGREGLIMLSGVQVSCPVGPNQTGFCGNFNDGDRQVGGRVLTQNGTLTVLCKI